MTDSVWVQLFCEGEKEAISRAFEIEPIPKNVNGLAQAVKAAWGDRLPAAAPELQVFAAGTAVPVPEGTESLRPGAAVRTETTTDENPLIVIAPKLPPQQLLRQPQLPAETLAGLNAMALDYLAKKRTIVLSDITSTAKDEILDKLHLPETGALWPNKPSTFRGFPGFEWRASSEDSPENRAAYIAHLKNNVQLPASYSIADVQPNRMLLSVELEELEVSQKIRGTTDVVIAESRNVQNDTIRNSVEALLELKKPKNMRSKDHNSQTVCAHLAASYLNRSCAVVSALTDLNRSWTFYWFAETEGGARVAIYKLRLEDEEGAAGLAKYVLESLNDESRRETLPTTFADRLSYDAVMDIIEDSRRKRARRDFDGGGGSSFRGQDGKPAARGHQHPLSRPGGNSLSGMESQNNDDGAGMRTMDRARTLSLFAPPSNRDVANELELLDMVDEAEQYEIVRSFAAKHIVPYMTGHNITHY